MLQTIRDRASGWFAYIVIGLLIVPFALWGINHYTDSGSVSVAAEVNGDAITLQQYQQALQRQRQRLVAALGADRVDESRLKREVLDGLIDERLLERFVRETGLTVSDAQVAGAIHGIAAFQQNGNFSPELYERAVRAQGYTAQGFEQMLRGSMSADQLRQGVAATALLTPGDRQRLVELVAQRRDFDVLTLSLAAFREREKPTDAEIDAHFKAYPERYVSPEQVRVEYLELKPGGMAAAGPDENVLRELYREQLAQFTQQEERVASHILVRLPANPAPDQIERARTRAQAMADDIAGRRKNFDALVQEVRAGADPAVEGGELGTLAKGVMDPAFDQALFELQAVGDVSAPVRTDFGFHLIRLDAIVPAKVQPFEDVREQLAQSLQRQQIDGRFYETAEKLSNLAFENPDSLAPAAQALGMPVAQSAWLSREGDDSEVFGNPKVLAAAFSDDVLKAGRNSEPVQIDTSHVVVLRVAEHREASPRTLDDAREQVRADVGEEQARRAVVQAQEQLAGRIRSGETAATLASLAGARLTTSGLVLRSAPGIDQTVIREAFRLPHGADDQPAVGSTALPNGDRVLIVLKTVKPGVEADIAEAEQRALLDRVRTQLGAVQLQGLIDEWRRQAKIVSHIDRL